LTHFFADSQDYLFKDTKIARLTYSCVLHFYVAFDSFGNRIGCFNEARLPYINSFLIKDKIPCVDIVDCFSSDEDADDYFSKVRNFEKTGLAHSRLTIRLLTKNEVPAHP